MQSQPGQTNKLNGRSLALSFAILISINAASQDKIIRKDLLTASTGSGMVSKVDIKEVTIPAGQKVPYHKHPCPVVGYVAAGTVLFQVEGEPSKILKTGDAFFEPAGTPITHFDNASETEPLKFIACYLVNKETELIQILPPKSNK